MAAASGTLKKLEDAWRSFKILAANGSSCSSWFKLQRVILDLQPIDYLQSIVPDGTSSTTSRNAEFFLLKEKCSGGFNIEK